MGEGPRPLRPPYSTRSLLSSHALLVHLVDGEAGQPTASFAPPHLRRRRAETDRRRTGSHSARGQRPGALATLVGCPPPLRALRLAVLSPSSSCSRGRRIRRLTCAEAQALRTVRTSSARGEKPRKSAQSIAFSARITRVPRSGPGRVLRRPRRRARRRRMQRGFVDRCPAVDPGPGWFRPWRPTASRSARRRDQRRGVPARRRDAPRARPVPAGEGRRHRADGGEPLGPRQVSDAVRPRPARHRERPDVTSRRVDGAASTQLTNARLRAQACAAVERDGAARHGDRREPEGLISQPKGRRSR